MTMITSFSVLPQMNTSAIAGNPPLLPAIPGIAVLASAVRTLVVAHKVILDEDVDGGRQEDAYRADHAREEVMPLEAAVGSRIRLVQIYPPAIQPQHHQLHPAIHLQNPLLGPLQHRPPMVVSMQFTPTIQMWPWISIKIAQLARC